MNRTVARIDLIRGLVSQGFFIVKEIRIQADLNPGTGVNDLMVGTLDAGVRYLPENGHNGNGNGTSKAEVPGDQSALVAMEARFDSLFAKGKVNQNSWLKNSSGS
jgi:hypothetical protein